MIDFKKALSWYGIALAVGMLVAYLWPVSFWLTLDSVTVQNAPYGVSPKMQVERKIKRPFFATWQVELEKQNSFGRFSFVTKAPGENGYTPSSGLPDDLDLDWWTYPAILNPEPGTYRIETCWKVKVYAFPKHPICVVSNAFTIGEPNP